MILEKYMDIDVVKLAENAAAISAVFHQHKDFDAAYASVQDNVGGFPGLWRLCAEVARIVTEQEQRGTLEFDESRPEWIDFVDHLVDALVEFLRTHEHAPDTLAVTGMIARAAIAAEG